MTTTEDRTDPDGAPLAYDPDDFTSDLELIAREVIEQAAPLTRILHPKIDRYVLVFESEISWELIEKYQKKASRGGKRNARLMNGLVVGNHCVHIERDGEPLRDSADNPLNFRSVELHELLKVGTAVDAAVQFLGGDGYLAAVAGKVMEKAGYGADIEDGDRPDPTGLG